MSEERGEKFWIGRYEQNSEFYRKNSVEKLDVYTR